MYSKQKPRMYQNQFMELLSMSGPKLMISFHLILITCQICYGRMNIHYNLSIWLLFLIFCCGVTFWTLAEYILHRHLFHLEGQSKLIQAFHYAMHGYHHEHPTDANRLFMPPVPALMFLSLFWGMFYLFIGKYVWFFIPGFELGYLVYSFIHYSIHTRKAPKVLQALWHHHILHHYKEPEKAFGVSSRLWDRIFRTLPQ